MSGRWPRKHIPKKSRILSFEEGDGNAFATPSKQNAERRSDYKHWIRRRQPTARRRAGQQVATWKKNVE